MLKGLGAVSSVKETGFLFFAHADELAGSMDLLCFDDGRERGDLLENGVIRMKVVNVSFEVDVRVRGPGSAQDLTLHCR